MQGGFTQPVQVLIDTTTQAVTNAAITLTGPSLSLPVTYNYNATAGGYYLAYYNSISSWGYTANQNYTMTISYGGHTYQCTVTSVGNVTWAPGTSGVTISWAGRGQREYRNGNRP